MAKLPERERTNLQLRFFEDLTQSEIAERLDISQMHVSRLLRRTLLQLREQLETGGA
jgi:RNA polymerase sigma-B factor